jgi:hypothetical protein
MPGRAVTGTFGVAPAYDDLGVPTEPVLRSQGGGGGDHHFAQRYWCFQLPSAGPMRVWVEWEPRGLPETSVTVDAGLVRDAAPRAVTLWEWTPDAS